jgi:transcriptional regulator with PAS, ATPase and Fis domain
MLNMDYFEEIPSAITVCDAEGIILYMNTKSASNYQKDGGKALVGRSLYDCHPGASKDKLRALIESHLQNSYSIEKNGIYKMIQQVPWFEEGVFKGVIEFSFEIPNPLPHFIRG